MKKTVRTGRSAPFPAPSLFCHYETQRAPVDEDRFMRYYQTAIEATSIDGPPPSTKDRVVPHAGETHTNVVDVVFGDSLLSRMAIALKKRMTEEGRMDELASVWTRILALTRAIGDGSLRQWAISRPRDPQHLYYPDAVVFAAAVAPLRDDCTLQVGEFERLVRVRLGGINCGRIIAWA
jgi:hypothetical protein